MDLAAIWEFTSGPLIEFGGRLVLALLLLLVGWIAAGWVSGLALKALRRAEVDETLARFLGRVAKWIGLGLVFLACLEIFGIEMTAFAALVASAGIAIGLAFQGTLSNVAAGLMLLMLRPFSVGDAVNVSGNLGVVQEIGLFTTMIDTFDNRRFIIPNGDVFGSTIENLSYHPHRRVDVAVGVDYSADIDATREVLEKAAESVPGRLDDPAPAIVLLDLGDSAVNWSVRVWAKSSEFGDVKQSTIRAIKVGLDDAKMGIPFPQMDVHVTQATS